MYLFHKIDLRLAAELGKNLLARNAILEDKIKEQQSVIEDKDAQIKVSKKHPNHTRTFSTKELRIVLLLLIPFFPLRFCLRLICFLIKVKICIS